MLSPRPKSKKIYLAEEDLKKVERGELSIKDLAARAGASAPWVSKQLARRRPARLDRSLCCTCGYCKVCKKLKQQQKEVEETRLANKLRYVYKERRDPKSRLTKAEIQKIKSFGSSWASRERRKYILKLAKEKGSSSKSIYRQLDKFIWWSQRGRLD
jgi:hypothetical protein